MNWFCVAEIATYNNSVTSGGIRMRNSLQSISSAGKLCSLCMAGFLVFSTHTAFSATLEEVIVTAQKREQSLTDVPIAIQAFSGEFILDNNIYQIADLSERVPNVQYSASPFQPIVAVRGLGASGGNRGFESQVVLFSDGIYGGRPTQFLAPMFDVERIELVKGPQAVLFGKNATGGVVSVVSARPGDEFEGYLSGGYEAEYDGYSVEGVLSGPVSDELGARLAMRFKEDGGYLRNTRFNRDEPEVENLAIRGVITWAPSATVDVVAKLEYTEMDTDGRDEQLVCTTEGVDFIQTPFGSTECVRDGRRDNGAAAGPYALFNDNPQVKSIDTMNASVNIDWDVGDHVLTLLGGYSRFDNLNETEVSPDFSSVGLLDGKTKDGKFDQYSVEARIASPTGGQLEYILGAFYLDSEEHLEQGLGLVLPPNPLFPAGAVMNKVFDLDQEVQTWSIFGSVTLNINDRLSATAQVRYSEEDKDFTSDIYQLISQLGGPAADPDLRAVFLGVDTPRDQLPPLTDYALGRSEEVVDYAFNLKWDMTDNLMAYISYGKGSKAGGYNFFPISITTPFALAPEDISYEEEEGRSVEGGIKATLLDNRAQFNLAVFHTEYDDMQQITFSPQRGGFDIDNANVTSVGVELDGQILISEQLRVGGAVGYLDAEFDNFTGVDCPNPPNQGNCNFLVGQTLDGDALPFAPEWTLNLFADFTMPIGSDHRLKLHVNGNFTDDILFQIDRDPFDAQDSYWIWNGRLALEPLSERWELSVQAKNLGDEDRIATYSADSVTNNLAPFAGAHMYILRPGRQLYLQARWNF